MMNLFPKKPQTIQACSVITVNNVFHNLLASVILQVI